MKKLLALIAIGGGAYAYMSHRRKAKASLQDEADDLSGTATHRAPVVV